MTSIASNNDIDLMKYVFCDHYYTSVKRKSGEQYKIKCDQNAFVHSSLSARKGHQYQIGGGGGKMLPVIFERYVSVENKHA